MEETTDDDRQEVVAKPEGEKGMGATIAIGGPSPEVVHPHAAGMDVGNSTTLQFGVDLEPHTTCPYPGCVKPTTFH